MDKPRLWDIKTPRLYTALTRVFIAGKLVDSTEMVGFVKELDPTRPVGLAQCVPESAKSQLPAALDVAGWNYARRYAISRERWPSLPIVYTESASAYSTRGYFDDFPMPASKDDYPATARISSYDHNSAWHSDPIYSPLAPSVGAVRVIWRSSLIERSTTTRSRYAPGGSEPSVSNLPSAAGLMFPPTFSKARCRPAAELRKSSSQSLAASLLRPTGGITGGTSRVTCKHSRLPPVHVLPPHSG